MPSRECIEGQNRRIGSRHHEVRKELGRRRQWPGGVEAPIRPPLRVVYGSRMKTRRPGNPHEYGRFESHSRTMSTTNLDGVNRTVTFKPEPPNSVHGDGLTHGAEVARLAPTAMVHQTVAPKSVNVAITVPTKAPTRMSSIERPRRNMPPSVMSVVNAMAGVTAVKKNARRDGNPILARM